jgi:DnaB-like helicase N terminal domain/AAA domain
MSTVPFNSGRKYPLPSDVAKKLPHNLDAERAVLGAVLLDNQALKAAVQETSAKDFFIQQHVLIFEYMLRLEKNQHAIDLLTLTDELSRDRYLEAVGGAAYLASLLDGIPKVVNVKYYAGIVARDARRRRTVHRAYKVEQMAHDESIPVEDVEHEFEMLLKEEKLSSAENPATVVGFSSLLTRQCAPVEYAIEPLLSSRGTGEIYGWRGSGKSYFATQTAFDIATGRPTLWGGHQGGGGAWPVTRAFRPLYVYGEMDDTEIQERARNIAKMRGQEIPSDEQFGTLCMDYQKGWRPKICSSRDRKIIEERLFSYGYEMLILDNISTLWPASQENQTDRSALLADWYADLNQRGISVIFLHHAGKGGQQRGDSEKEDMLSFVIALRKPGNYKEEQQLRVEIHVEKHRHKAIHPRWLMPFELQLTKDDHGNSEWVTRTAKDAQLESAFLMFKDDMPPMFIAQEVGVSKSTIYRYKNLYKENSDYRHWLGQV